MRAQLMLRTICAMHVQIILHVYCNFDKVMGLNRNISVVVMRVLLPKERRLGSEYLDASEFGKKVA